MNVEQELVDLLERFRAGPNRSIEAANAIEGHVVRHFCGDDDYQALLQALACYRPEGGAYLFDEAAMLSVVRNELARLRKKGP